MSCEKIQDALQKYYIKNSGRLKAPWEVGTGNAAQLGQEARDIREIAGCHLCTGCGETPMPQEAMKRSNFTRGNVLRR